MHLATPWLASRLPLAFHRSANRLILTSARAGLAFRQRAQGLDKMINTARDSRSFGSGLRLALAVCLASAAVALRAGDMAPDFAKLAPVAACPSLVDAARAADLPLAGIDPPGEAGSLKPGDSVTALVTLFEKGRQPAQWLLEVKAAAPYATEKPGKPRAPSVWYTTAGDKLEFASSQSPVNLLLLGPFAEAGGKSPRAKEQKARFTLDKGFLGLGFDEAAAAIVRMRQAKLTNQFEASPEPFTPAQIAAGKKAVAALGLTPTEQRALAGLGPALLSYFELVQHTPGLDRLFYKVVDLPSVWSIVRHVGTKASLELEPEHFAPLDTAAWGLPTKPPGYAFPMAFRLNGQPALTVTLVVAPPRPPLLACGGIIGLLAEKPSEKETYLTLRILSARHK